MLALLKKKHKTSFPLIEAQMVVTSHNENDCDTFRNDMKKAGADIIKLKSAWFPDLNDPSLPVPIKNSRYRKNPDGTWSLRKSIRNKCSRIFTTMVVTFNGDIIPCCFDKNCSYVMGNINNKPLLKIWKNVVFRKFRKGILDDREKTGICNNCLS